MTGRGGDALNGIGFGTWAWGNQLLWGYDAERDDRLLEETFRQALASGLGLIDTADSYGTGRLNGRSEQLLGRFAARLPATRRADLCIATKLAPFPWRLGRRGLDQALQASRQRLQGHLRRVQLHWSTARYAPWQEVQLLDGLADRVLDGSISEIGVSNIGPKRLAWMQQRLAERGVPLRSVQVQYSLLSPGDAKVDAARVGNQKLSTSTAGGPQGPWEPPWSPKRLPESRWSPPAVAVDSFWFLMLGSLETLLLLFQGENQMHLG